MTRPGWAMAFSTERNARWASRTGSAKPASILVVSAHEREELHAGGRRALRDLPATLLLARFQGSDDTLLELGGVDGILEEGIEDRGQLGVPSVASGDVGVARDPGRQINRAADRRHLAKVEGCPAAAGPSAHHDEAHLGLAHNAVCWPLPQSEPRLLDLRPARLREHGHPAPAHPALSRHRTDPPSLEVGEHLAHAPPAPAGGTPALEIEDGRRHAHALLARHLQRSAAPLAVGHPHDRDHALADGLPGVHDYFWAASFLAVSFSSRMTWYFPSSAGTKPESHAPISLKASGFLAFMLTNDSWMADLRLGGRSLRTTMGSLGMSFDTQITRRPPRGTLFSRVSCWRSGRLVEATSTFLLATARIEASWEPEKVTLEKYFFGSTFISVMKNVDGTR